MFLSLDPGFAGPRFRWSPVCASLVPGVWLKWACNAFQLFKGQPRSRTICVSHSKGMAAPLHLARGRFCDCGGLLLLNAAHFGVEFISTPQNKPDQLVYRPSLSDHYHSKRATFRYSVVHLFPPSTPLCKNTTQTFRNSSPAKLERTSSPVVDLYTEVCTVFSSSNHGCCMKLFPTPKAPKRRPDHRCKTFDAVKFRRCLSPHPVSKTRNCQITKKYPVQTPAVWIC